MRIASSIAAVLTLALAACNDSQPAAPAPDPAAAAAATQAVVADALAAQDGQALALHGDAGPGVYFVNLRDGMTVPPSFRVVFGVYGMGVAPALVDKPNTGHHHLLIDTELSADEMQYAIPKDDTHLHFGAGETETVLMLPPGQHTLQLAFGDLNHELHKPAPIMSKKITVTVR
jgi:hypothetical protein